MFQGNTSFYERTKEIITKTWTLHERIVQIKKKGKVHIMNFQRRKLVERWSFFSLYETCMILRTEKDDLLVLKKTVRWYFWTFMIWKVRCFFWSNKLMKDYISFSGEYHFYWLVNGFCFKLFGGIKYGLFLIQNVDGKIIFAWYFWDFLDIPGLGKYGFWSFINLRKTLDIVDRGILLQKLEHYGIRGIPKCWLSTCF